jgi:hypothetical protein
MTEHSLCAEMTGKQLCATGWSFHVGFYDEYETGKVATNALVQGLTFQDAKNHKRSRRE